MPNQVPRTVLYPEDVPPPRPEHEPLLNNDDDDDDDSSISDNDDNEETTHIDVDSKGTSHSSPATPSQRPPLISSIRGSRKNRKSYGTVNGTNGSVNFDSASLANAVNNGNRSTNGRHRRYNSTASAASVKSTTSFVSRTSSITSVRRLTKTQSHSFYEDAKYFNSGSVPHSMVLALVIGVVCGISAYIYYEVLFWLLNYIWHTLPQQVIGWFDGPTTDDTATSSAALIVSSLWIPSIGFLMALFVGLTVQYMGEPGDLPYTIKCVHDQAYVAMDHVMPMVAASQFSILGGGSLGPEAPLVAISAALGGFISRTVFGQTNRNLVRKHTLMGMAGALAAFFGVPLGGSLFALEVNSRMGAEYFEHVMESILCGEICLAVFRACAGLPIESIWKLTEVKLHDSSSLDIVYGAVLGLVGATIAWLFAQFHKMVLAIFAKYHLIGNTTINRQNAIKRAMAGAVVVVGLGILVPHTMFWGEYEFQTIATLGPANDLHHIWPTNGGVPFLHFELHDNAWSPLLVGIAKLVAISFTVAGGYRGGYIFPAFAAAAAFGRTISYLCPFIPVQLCVLCMAAALNVALTRTAIATTLILAYLSGEQAAMPSITAAALVSLFVTAYMPFIQTQSSRSDLEDAIFTDFELEIPADDGETSDETGEDALTPLSSFGRKATGTESELMSVGV